jgi:hypothetical protein
MLIDETLLCLTGRYFSSLYSAVTGCANSNFPCDVVLAQATSNAAELPIESHLL